MLRNLQDEPTLSRGNCAFHALALALCTPGVFEQLEFLIKQNNAENTTPFAIWSYFIACVAEALKVDCNWSVIKEKLIALRKRGLSSRLQEMLAPILRELAILRMRVDPESLEYTEQPLLSAFRLHAYKTLQLDVPKAQDDVYSRHPFIVSRFKQVTRWVSFLLRQEPVGFDFKRYIELMSFPDRTSTEEAELTKLISGLSRSLQRKHVKIFPMMKENYVDIVRYRLLNAKNRDVAEAAELKQLEERLDVIFIMAQKKLLKWWKRSSKSGYQRFLDAMKVAGEWAGYEELSVLGKYFKVNIDVYLNDLPEPQRIHYECGELPVCDEGYKLTPHVIQQLMSCEIVDRSAYVTNILQNRKMFQHAQKTLLLSLLPMTLTKLREKLASIEGLLNQEVLVDAWQKAYREYPVVSLKHANGHWSNRISDEKKAELSRSSYEIFTQTSLYIETLRALESNKIHFYENKWKEIIANADRVCDTNKIEYAADGVDVDYPVLSDDDDELRQSIERAKSERDILYVDDKVCEELDAEFAKKMQLEIYREFKCK